MKAIDDYLRTVLQTLRFGIGELLTVNVLWVLLMLPIITIPPAFAGLYYATNLMAKERVTGFRTFFEGFKKYFFVSYLWFLANAVVFGLLLFNIFLGVQRPELPWLQFVGVINWIVLFLWSPLQIYTFPFLIEQNEARLNLALRNSAVLWFKHIRFNLFLVLLFGIVALASLYVYPFWFVLTAALLAYMSNLGLLSLLSREKRASDGE